MLRDRLIQFIKSQHLTVSKFEQIVGLSNGAVSRTNEKIRQRTLTSISDKFPFLNIDWLITGEGDMLIENYAVDNSQDYMEDEDNDNDMVPLLPVSAIAGTLQGFSQSVMLRDCQKIKSPVSGADWAIQISGDSMSPKLENGEYIYISKVSGSFIAWGQIYVLDTQDGVYVKKIMPVEDDESCIWAVSINPAYPPFKINTSEIIGLYRILGGSFIVSTM